jgi:polyphenol oxidase
VELYHASLPEAAVDSVAMAFPPPPGARYAPLDEPSAFLTLAALGDMKFGYPPSAPNRAAFLIRLGLEPGACLGLDLAHSRKVILVEPGAPHPAARAEGGEAVDGILLRDRAFSASVTVADCMPIWLLDRGSGAFGVLHSGWKGTGILASALGLLGERFGTRPDEVAVILGPAIGACCYQVDEGRAGAFAAEFGARSVSRRPGPASGAPALDLRAANLAMAEKAGVGSLLSIEACTSCDPRLGSFRRQGPAAFTRMMALCAYASRSPVAAVELSR